MFTCMYCEHHYDWNAGDVEERICNNCMENGCELCDEGGEAPLRDDGINVCDKCNEKHPISDFGGR